MQILYKEDWQTNSDESRMAFKKPVLETRKLEIEQTSPPNPFYTPSTFVFTKEYELYEKTPKSIKFSASNFSKGVIYGDSFFTNEKWELFTPDPRSNQVVMR